jgi:hypothetical protein
MTNKYIFNFTDFLIEQDMGSVLGAPAAPVAATPAIKYDFLFMTGSDDAGNNRRKYPDGSIIIEYPCYSIKSEDLEKWTKDNIISSDKNKLNTPELEVRRKSIVDIVKGDRINISNDDLPFIEKLKNATSANLIGKIEPDVSVIFSDGKPTTDNINVTFIKHKK